MSNRCYFCGREMYHGDWYVYLDDSRRVCRPCCKTAKLSPAELSADYKKLLGRVVESIENDPSHPWGKFVEQLKAARLQPPQPEPECPVCGPEGICVCEVFAEMAREEP